MPRSQFGRAAHFALGARCDSLSALTGSFAPRHERSADNARGTPIAASGGMLGAYGGTIEAADGGTRERAAPEIVELLRGGAPAPSLDVVWLTTCDGELDYDADLALLPALRLGERELGSELSAVAHRVAELHAVGRVHGDIRPALLRHSDRGLALIVPSATVDAPALLRARLRSGADPLDVAFAAPEVAHGAPATPASDVYALAAIAFAMVARRAPLALGDAQRVLAPLGEDVAGVLCRALDADPRTRPDARALAQALAAIDAREPDVARAEGPPLLMLVLAVGAALVFTGALGVAIARWTEVGEAARLAALALLTSLVLGGGTILAGRGARSGIGLVALGIQLVWADAWLALAMLDLERSYGAWALVGVSVGAVECLLAARMRSALLGWFAIGAFTESAVTLGLLLPVDSGLGAAGYAALVAIANALGVGLAKRWKAPNLVRPLATAAAAWTCASAAASLVSFEARPSASAFVWPYALALGVLYKPWDSGRATAAGLLLVVPSLHATLLASGPSFATAAAMGTLALAALAAWRARLAQSGWAAAFAAVAVAWVSVSAIASLWRTDAFGVVAPYALAGALASTAWIAARSGALLARKILLGAAFGLCLVLPTAHALMFREHLVALLLVVAGGLSLVALGFGSPLLGSRSRERAAIAIGAAAVAGAPGIVALGAGLGSILSELSPDAWFRLSTALVGSLALSALAAGVGPIDDKRDDRRAVELAAVALGPGVLLVLSLSVARDDLGYVALLFAIGAALLVLALTRRRIALGVGSAVVILTALSTQYFAKLSLTIHWGLLAVGFGLGLLFAAMLWERRLKSLLAARDRWQWGESSETGRRRRESSSARM